MTSPFDPTAARQRNLHANYPPTTTPPRWFDPGNVPAEAGQPSAHERYRHPVGDMLAQGFAPPGLEQTDHTIIRHGGLYHMYATAATPGTTPLWPGQHHFIFHACTPDLIHWTLHGPVLYNKPEHDFEAKHCWPPFVLQHDDGRFAMIYCGMDAHDCQRLCLAWSDDLFTWTRHEGNPVIEPADYEWVMKHPSGKARHGRDPHVQRVGDWYLCYYTTLAADGYSAVAIAASKDLIDWQDLGPCFKRDASKANWLTESPLLIERDGRFFMLPSQSPGITCFVSEDPTDFHNAQEVPVVNGEKVIAPEVADARFPDRYLITCHGLTGMRLNVCILHWEANGSVRFEHVTRPEQLADWLES